MGLLSGIVRAAGALIGGAIGGPAGAAIGGGLATKLTGGSTKDALLTGAVSGIGSYALPKLGASLGIGGDAGPDYMPRLAGEGAPVIDGYARPGMSMATEGPGFLDRAVDALSNKSTLATVGLGGLMAAGAMQQPQQSSGSYLPPPAGSEAPINVRPMSRNRRSYTGDERRYAEQPGEFQYFDEVNPAPVYYRRGGRVRGYATGGRTYVPYGGGLGSYGLGGEHRFFTGSADSAPLGAPQSPAASDDGGMFRYTATGEPASNPGGDPDRDTGSATVSTLGDFAKAALSGLSMFSPAGFAVGMGFANQGHLGTMNDALSFGRGVVDNLTENVDSTDPFGYRDSNWGQGASGGLGAMTDSQLSDGTVAGQEGPAASVGGDTSGGMSDPGQDGMSGNDSNYRRGGRTKRRGIGFSIPSPAARAARIKGRGTGQSDEIPAALSDGEHVLDADLVSMIGDGSNDAGHRRLEQMKRSIRAHKRSAPAGKIPPKARGLGSYMKAA